ncbi:hypothetical protein HMPREF0549_1551, partial [Limosilactobacillus vaginalis DSM 5837 = ATCC 49540]
MEKRMGKKPSFFPSSNYLLFYCRNAFARDNGPRQHSRNALTLNSL